MSIITTPATMTTELTLVNGSDWLAGVESLSALSPEVALNMPLGELVQTTLTAAATDSQNTARAYQTAIGLFLAWLGGELGDRLPPEWQPLAKPTKEGHKTKNGRIVYKTVWEIRGQAAVLRTVSAGVLDNFIAWRSAEGDSRQTLALRRGAVSTFLRVAYRDGVLTHDQALNMGLKPYQKKQRRDEKPVGRRLTPQEVRALRETVLLKARQDRKAARDRALVDCMLFAGLRRDEVASLTTGNITQDGGRWWLVLTGKGSKTRRVKLHDMLYKSLQAWGDSVGLTLGAGEEPLFYNLTKGGQPTGKQLNSSVIGRIVAEYGALANLAPASGKNCLSPHDLRRTFARNAYDNGAPLPVVQAALGHSDVKTTMRYIGAMDNDDDTAVDYVHY